MSLTNERTCPLILAAPAADKDGAMKMDEIFQKLEKGDDDDKIEALKMIIHNMMSGIDMSRATMQVIKFCLRSKNHMIKKLISLYWEVLDKKTPEGRLREEMILVCNHLQNDLKHANEYVRGSSCRLLCRIGEAEILEQVIPQLLVNIEHRHSYVRKLCVLAILSVHSSHPELIPDAPQSISAMLNKEGNQLTKRNAFLMLLNSDMRLALEYFSSMQDQVLSLPEHTQLLVLELMRKWVRAQAGPKSLFVKCAASLLNAQSNAVIYDAANTLLVLTPLDSAVNRSLEAYTQLLQSESDQNVKLIVINRLLAMKSRYERNLRHILMDVLRGLSAPNLDVRSKILQLALQLVTPANINDVIGVLKKEILGTESTEGDPLAQKYRALLVETIHQCAVKFPEVAASVVHLLMNYLSDESAKSASDVIYFVREILEEYPDLRGSILEKLLDTFNDIRADVVYRVGLWIFGEYCESEPMIFQAFQAIKKSVGELPIQPNVVQQEVEEEKKLASDEPQFYTRTIVLDDGTYATETARVNPALEETGDGDSKAAVSLRSLLKQGQYFFVNVLAMCLTKMTLRLRELTDSAENLNRFTGECMLVLVSIVRFAEDKRNKNQIDHDTRDRVLYCLSVLMNPDSSDDDQVFLTACRETFAAMLQQRRMEEENRKKELESEQESATPLVPFDSLLNIRQLKGLEFSEFDESDDLNVLRAVGNKSLDENLANRLSRVHQLTGFSDPVYAEACVTVHQFDIVLDFLLINNTGGTLQNLQLELHTSGDLKLVEKPQKKTLGPYSAERIQASIKVSSTENGVIFGNIVYDTTGATADNNIVVMNCIHMDIMDYVSPAPCPETDFRDMWAEFEWENKVPVNTDISDLNEYLSHIQNITNMCLLTPMNKMGAECQFLAANLHAKSIFGEHALMNVSIEMNEETDDAENVTQKIVGHIRIRCKSQGIALSLGEKITNKQRKKDIVNAESSD